MIIDFVIISVVAICFTASVVFIYKNGNCDSCGNCEYCRKNGKTDICVKQRYKKICACKRINNKSYKKNINMIDEIIAKNEIKK